VDRLIRTIGQAQFTKFDARSGEFVAVMTSETPDEDREIFDLASSQPYVEAWSQRVYEMSKGKSFGNVREMHGLSAVGKLTRPPEFDTKNARVLVHGAIVDPVAKRKAEEGVLIGVSIGGRYVDRWPDPDVPGCTRYTADLTELSLVDSPNNPDAEMELIGPGGAVKLVKFSGPPTVEPEFDSFEDPVLLKAARLVVGADRPLAKEKKTKRVGGKNLPSSAFAHVGDPDQPETWKYPIHDAAHVRNALARWGQEKGIPASAKTKVYARIKAAAKRFGVDVSTDAEKIIKSLYDVGGVASCLQNLEYLRASLAREAEYEGDDSAVPGNLRDTMASLGEVLKELAAEETDELLALSASATEE